MEWAVSAILFLFGIAIGSFLNVVTLRYDGEHFLLNVTMIGGRSRCPHCKRTLRWFELIPILSFVIQGGRCRRCRAWLNVQYPAIELFSGLVFVFVPFVLGASMDGASVLVSVLWVAVFEALLVMAAIDIRLGIIPDEVNIFLGMLGVFLTIIVAGSAGGAGESVVFAKLAGAVVAGVFFAFLIAITRGKGMGVGDLKLAIPLGLLFGWPDILLVLVSAFVIGAVFGVLAVARGKKRMGGTLPFGPFLGIGAAVAFFWAAPIIGWYLSLLGVR